MKDPTSDLTVEEQLRVLERERDSYARMVSEFDRLVEEAEVQVEEWQHRVAFNSERRGDAIREVTRLTELIQERLNAS